MPAPLSTRHQLFFVSVLCLVVSLCLTGCLTARRLTYFQKEIPGLDTLVKPYSINPGPGDVLLVQVNSFGAKSPSVINPYSPIPADPIAPPPGNATGYLIDKQGMIDLPLIGSFIAAGKSTTQIEDSVRQKLQPYLVNPSVMVRLANLRITVLGEVNKPATLTFNYYIPALPQVLGMAGDLTAYARRDNILVIRQIGRESESRRSYARLDLTKASVLNSPYYYLQPNDVVYVAPTNSRAASVDRTYQILPIVLSAVSVIATVLSIALR